MQDVYPSNRAGRPSRSLNRVNPSPPIKRPQIRDSSVRNLTTTTKPLSKPPFRTQSPLVAPLSAARNEERTVTSIPVRRIAPDNGTTYRWRAMPSTGNEASLLKNWPSEDHQIPVFLDFTAPNTSKRASKSGMSEFILRHIWSP